MKNKLKKLLGLFVVSSIGLSSVAPAFALQSTNNNTSIQNSSGIPQLPASCTLNNQIKQGVINTCEDLLSIDSYTHYTFGKNNIDCSSLGTVDENTVDPNNTSASLSNNDTVCTIIEGSVNQNNGNPSTFIRNLTIDNTTEDTMGILEEFIDSVAVNLSFEDVSIKGRNTVGIFGLADNSTFKNIDLNRVDIDGSSRVGALIGDLKANYSSQPTVVDVEDVNIRNSNLIAKNRMGSVIGNSENAYIKDILVAKTSVEQRDNSNLFAGAIFGLASQKANKWENITGRQLTLIARKTSSGLLAGLAKKGTEIINVELSDSKLTYVSNKNDQESSIGGLIGEYGDNGVIDGVKFNRVTVEHMKEGNTPGVFDQEGSANLDKVGGLIGYVNGSNININNVKTNKTVITGFDDEVGGFIGAAEGSVTITNSDSNNTQIIGNTGSNNSLNGGLIGANYGGTVTITDSCARTNKFEVDDDEIGGLIGRLENSAEITRSAAMGKIENADSDVGGLIGYVNDLRTINITDSYSRVALKNITKNVGGLIGDLDAGSSNVPDQNAVVNLNNVYFVGPITSVENNEEYPLVGEIGNNSEGFDVNFTNAYFSTWTPVTPDENSVDPNFNLVNSSTPANVAIEIPGNKRSLRSSYQGFDFNNVWYLFTGHGTPELRTKGKNLPVTAINLDQPNSALDNLAAGSVIGTVSAVDLENDPTTCEVLTDAAIFELVENTTTNELELKNKVQLGSSTNSGLLEYDVEISCNDSNAASRSRETVFTLTDTKTQNVTASNVGAENSEEVTTQATPLTCEAAGQALITGFDSNNDGTLSPVETLRMAIKANQLNNAENDNPSVLASNYPEFDLNKDGNIDNLDRIYSYADCNVEYKQSLNAAELLDRNLDGKLPKKFNKKYKKAFRAAKQQLKAASGDMTDEVVFDLNNDGKLNKADKKIARRLLRDVRKAIETANSAPQMQALDNNNGKLPLDLVQSSVANLEEEI
jgi:hypothetical protein